MLDGVLGGASIFEVSRDEEKKRNDFTYQVLTIELDDREDILTIEKKYMCQIFRSSQKNRVNPSDDRNKSTQKTDDLAKRLYFIFNLGVRVQLGL